jgi:hypothetical protein
VGVVCGEYRMAPLSHLSFLVQMRTQRSPLSFRRGLGPFFYLPPSQQGKDYR